MATPPGGAMTDPVFLPIDAGLLDRFRTAGSGIAWRSAGTRRGDRGARIAHLNDEECRVEERRSSGEMVMRTDSGPVGALVLLLEIDRRGPPDVLTTHENGPLPGFPRGSLEASWGGPSRGQIDLLPRDLVQLARYALA